MSEIMHRILWCIAAVSVAIGLGYSLKGDTIAFCQCAIIAIWITLSLHFSSFKKEIKELEDEILDLKSKMP